MDALSETVSLLRTKGQLYGRLEFAAPWGFEFPGGKSICLMVTRGSCFLGVDRQTALTPLVGGDFVVLSRPQSYSLRSSAERSLRSVQEVTTPEAFWRSRLIAYGGEGGLRTSLIAGCFTFATPESQWMAGYLPPVLHVSASEAHSPAWFQATLQFIESEIIQDLPGASTVVDRLAEVLFVQAVRTQITGSAEARSSNWLRALCNPEMAAALRLMHTQPEHPWTVPELAQAVSMSRSAFASRFRELVGTTPLDHLTEWRMVRAAGMMQEGHSWKLATYAAAVGYESEGAFARVFRRVMGVSPGKYQRKLLDKPTTHPAD